MAVLSTHLHSYHRHLCTDCLLDFHNPEALDKHRASAHFITNEPLIISQSTNSDSVQSSSSNPSTSSAEADQRPPTTPSPEEITPENGPPPQESTEENTVVEQEVDEIAPDAPQGPSPVTVSWRPRYPHFCKICRVGFPSEEVLRQKHVDAVHAPRLSQEQQQQPVTNNESDSLSIQVAAMGLDATESPVAPAPTDSPVVPEMRPLDRLFASISYPLAISPQETGAVDTSISTSSQILPPQDDARSPIDTVDTSDPTSTQLPTPPVLRPPENVEASPNPSSASSVVLSPPSPAPLPPRPDDFYCRKCKLSFANYQEQKDVRNSYSLTAVILLTITRCSICETEYQPSNQRRTMGAASSVFSAIDLSGIFAR
ncbi:hypothetical protein FRC04_001287 [Tulasnella sp. 424]|nr:hypothetical protein FRC04_001287 [Tulasnella sp. 424]